MRTPTLSVMADHTDSAQQYKVKGADFFNYCHKISIRISQSQNDKQSIFQQYKILKPQKIWQLTGSTIGIRKSQNSQ